MAAVLVTYVTDAENPAINIRIATDEVGGVNLSAAWSAVARYWGLAREMVTAKYDGSEFYEVETRRVLAHVRQATLQIAFDTSTH